MNPTYIENNKQLLESLSGQIMTGSVRLISDQNIIKELKEPYEQLIDDWCYTIEGCRRRIHIPFIKKSLRFFKKKYGFTIGLTTLEIVETLPYDELRTANNAPMVPVAKINMSKPKFAYSVYESFERLIELGNLVDEIEKGNNTEAELKQIISQDNGYDFLKYWENPKDIRNQIEGKIPSKTQNIEEITQIIGGTPIVVVYSKYLEGIGTDEEGIVQGHNTKNIQLI